MLRLIVLVALFSVANGFGSASPPSAVLRPQNPSTTQLYSSESNKNDRNKEDATMSNNGLFSMNPFREVQDMLANMDDVIDDFMFKRMGSGE